MAKHKAYKKIARGQGFKGGSNGWFQRIEELADVL